MTKIVYHDEQAITERALLDVSKILPKGVEFLFWIPWNHDDIASLVP